MITQKLETHPFFITEESMWPFYFSFSTFSLLMSFVFFCWKDTTTMSVLFNFLTFFSLFFLWEKDVNKESNLGNHTNETECSLKWSMGWFITSEVLFFFSFFWSFFSFSLSNSFDSGGVWPPMCVTPLSAFSIPLLNTVILLSSGISLTWGHHSILVGKWEESVQGIIMTILLGLYFSFLQLEEYIDCSFSFNDSLWGSIFFLVTGFHGLHVLIGTLFLISCLFSILFQMSFNNHHMTIEISSWYWHFVDVVWLMLFLSVYWWGS